MKTWQRRGLATTAIAYPIALILTAFVMRTGEGWWATGMALYLPWGLSAIPLPFITAALVKVRWRRLLGTQVVAALVIVFPLMGFVLPWPTLGTKEATVRVLSYNVNSAFGGVDRIIEEIDHFSPDIVFLQETNRGTERLIEALKAKYVDVRTSTQFVVASRFPISSMVEPEQLAGKGDRSPRFVKQVVDTPLGPIAFYNVHPISPRMGFYRLRGSGLKHEILTGHFFTGDRSDWMQGSAELRDHQVGAFAEQASQESYPVVIAGDTNLPGQSAIFRRHLSGYEDGFREAGWGFGYTFPANKVPWMRLDRILATEPLRFTRFEVGHSTASDHLCIVADLARR